MNESALETYLWWAATAGYLVLLLRIYRLGLHRTYRFFAGYLAFRVFRALALTLLPPVVQRLLSRPDVRFETDAYGWIWLVTQPMLWMAYILVVLELYSLVFQNYKGIASLSRWVLMAGLVLAIGISSLTLFTDLSNPGEQFPILLKFLVIDRGIVSSLVIFLLFITVFLTWYPVPLNRNVVVHCIVYALYFLSNAMLVFIRNVTGHEVTPVANIISSSIAIGCLLVWLKCLNLEGEEKTVALRQQWVEGENEVLVDQLSAINATLLRAARK